MIACCNSFQGCDGEADRGEIECPTCQKFGTYRFTKRSVRQATAIRAV